MDAGDYYTTHWYHLNCFELKPKFIDIDIIEQIYNLDQIDSDPADLDLVVNYINAEKERLKKGGKRVPPNPPNPPNSQGDDNKDKDESNDKSSKLKKSKKEEKQ